MNICTTMKAGPSTIGSDVYCSRYSSLTDYINHNQISGLRMHSVTPMERDLLPPA